MEIILPLNSQQQLASSAPTGTLLVGLIENFPSHLLFDGKLGFRQNTFFHRKCLLSTYHFWGKKKKAQMPENLKNFSFWLKSKIFCPKPETFGFRNGTTVPHGSNSLVALCSHSLLCARLLSQIS